MSKQVRKSALVVILAVIACMCFALFTVSSVKTNAAVAVDANETAESGFYMEDGAYIRLKEDGQGISFGTVVEENFYNELHTQYADKRIEFHTLINYNGLDVEAITLNNGSNQDVKKSESNLTFNSEGKNKFITSIIYNGETTQGVSDELIDKGIAYELSARSYVKVTDNGELVAIIYAKAPQGLTKNLRSMRGVANLVYEKLENNDSSTADLPSDSKQVLAGYLTRYNSTGTSVKDIENEGAFVEMSSGKMISPNVALGNTVEGYYGAQKYTVTYDAENNVYTTTGLTFADTELENAKNISLLGADGSLYRYGFKCVTKILSKATDLEMFTFGGVAKTVFDGYYVLSKDIDASNYKHQTPCTLAEVFDATTSKVYGLTGTFDGNGNTIDGITLLNAGLFGGVSGTIKNAAFTNVKFGTYSRADRGLFAAYMGLATLENLYINADMPDGGGGRALLSYIFVGGNSGINRITNVLIKTNTDLADTATGGVLFASEANGKAYSRRGDNAEGELYWNNVFVISNTELNQVYVSSTSTGTLKDAQNCTTTSREGYTIEKNYDGAFRYASDDTQTFISEQGSKFSDFSSKYWKVNETTGMLEFK